MNNKGIIYKLRKALGRSGDESISDSSILTYFIVVSKFIPWKCNNQFIYIKVGDITYDTIVSAGVNAGMTLNESEALGELSRDRLIICSYEKSNHSWKISLI